MESVLYSPTKENFYDKQTYIHKQKEEIKQTPKFKKNDSFKLNTEISKKNQKLRQLENKIKNLTEFKKFILIYKLNFNEHNLDIFNKNKKIFINISLINNMDSKFFINKLKPIDVTNYIFLKSLRKTFFNNFFYFKIKNYHKKMIELTTEELKTLHGFK